MTCQPNVTKETGAPRAYAYFPAAILPFFHSQYNSKWSLTFIHDFDKCCTLRQTRFFRARKSLVWRDYLTQKCFEYGQQRELGSFRMIIGCLCLKRLLYLIFRLLCSTTTLILCTTTLLTFFIVLMMMHACRQSYERVDGMKISYNHLNSKWFKTVAWMWWLKGEIRYFDASVASKKSRRS